MATGYVGALEAPPLGILGQNLIQMPENSLQFKNVWSKIEANCWAWSVNRNFVDSVKRKILTEGKFWFTNFTKNSLKWSAKRQSWLQFADH